MLPNISLPWTPFNSITTLPDYTRIHIWIVVCSVADLTKSSKGDNRREVRIRDEGGKLLNLVIWRDQAIQDHWKNGATLEIFHTIVNFDRQCVEINDDSRVRYSEKTFNVLAMHSATTMVDWPLFKRQKSS